MRIRLNRSLLSLLLLCGLPFVCDACRQKQKKNLFAGMDRRSKIRMKSYLVRGYHLYEAHCSPCHQQDGRGLKRLYPPLNGADYLLGHPDKSACIIRYGSKGGGVVNGIPYPTAMPAGPTLRNIEIAEILTYISNAWDNHNGFFPVKKVDTYLKTCRQGGQEKPLPESP